MTNSVIGYDISIYLAGQLMYLRRARGTRGEAGGADRWLRSRCVLDLNVTGRRGHILRKGTYLHTIAKPRSDMNKYRTFNQRRA
jgi:hypothetical protein